MSFNFIGWWLFMSYFFQHCAENNICKEFYIFSTNDHIDINDHYIVIFVFLHSSARSEMLEGMFFFYAFNEFLRYSKEIFLEEFMHRKFLSYDNNGI